MEITLLPFVIIAFITHGVSATEVTTIECGTINYSRGLISNGNKTERGEWPFLAALFLIKEEESDFLCGGTLISSKHVLTVARCIQEKHSPKKLLPGDINVLLGAYDLTSKTEVGVQQRDVHKIYIHPDWNWYTEKYDANVAVLLLSESVLFTDYIRPVCITADDTVVDDVIGSVVGWGSEIHTKPNLDFIRRTFVTVLSVIDCNSRYPELAIISSPRTFCGRGAGGIANNGDSGLYVQNEESVWVQCGLVSTVLTNETGYVDPDLPVVYINVPKFKNWIADTVSRSGATVGEAQAQFTKLDLNCLYAYDSITHKYACFIGNLNIQSDNVKVVSFLGSHLGKNTDDDVQQISFNDGTMFFIPSGVGHNFRNVKIIEIGEGLSTKRIKRSDFKSLEKLIELGIYKNHITTFDSRSFRDLKKLKVLTIAKNRLEEIEEGTFDMNVKLREVYLYGNKLGVIPRHLFRNNLLLRRVNLHNNILKTIDASTFAMNTKLRRVELNTNKLQDLPKKLFQNNLLLEVVHLDNNFLRIVDESTFEMNVNLKKVYLNGNKIEILPKNLFRNNALLKLVSFHSNSLTTIDESTFGMNIKLTTVFLYNNKLEYLPRNLFQNNLSLEIVDLRSNSLKLIETVFTPLKNIKQIYFYENICIDAYYEGNDPEFYRNHVRNLTEFHHLITSNCSSSNK